jgi:propionyl-CoA synthetase
VINPNSAGHLPAQESALIDHSSFYQRSLAEPDAFWAEQAGLIDWHRPFDQICDYSNPPFAR